MGDERFLIVSYFASGLFCACLAAAAYLWLRRPAAGVFKALQRPDWERILRRSFPTSTILLVLAAFLGVSYYSYGCEDLKYADIVSNRARIITIIHAQVSASLSSIVVAVVVWSAAILLCLLVVRRDGPKIPSSEND